MTAEPTSLARDLLVAVRTGESTRPFEERLADLDEETLAAALGNDDSRVAFWLNVYNAYAQLLLERYPTEYERSRRRFFGHEAVPIVGEWLSLDDIEHGLLRRSQSSLGLGYLPRLRPSTFERRHRIAERDPRIHFALNCGAKSCPPIRAYEAAEIDAQLDLATASYLDSEVEYDPGSGVVRVPRHMLWYRGDFGGKTGIVEMLRAFDCVPEGETVRVRYRDYDWTAVTDEYTEERIRDVI